LLCQTASSHPRRPSVTNIAVASSSAAISTTAGRLWGRAGAEHQPWGRIRRMYPFNNLGSNPWLLLGAGCPGCRAKESYGWSPTGVPPL
jgi:hypothetical protein